ncbi:hypothetical protein [Lysinibacillus sp. SGAir0095]|uniref:hypothetical protein n=1 Tax=Lysinibacillus sp. SGAir0095 TaxID=2070463 RepID=UPI0010CD661D|nr:hypothetical protein [Lysinibacillus sp. SGAir0095]QCR33114.1 hypothetical protein C1N55_13400 [Lysinibacillus sp. SGAir0095]
MAVTTSGSSTSSIQVEINGLGKPANQYYNFRAQILLGNTVVSEINWTSSGTGDLTRNTFYGLSPGTTYLIKAWVQSLASSSEIYWGQTYGATQSPPLPSTPSYASLTDNGNGYLVASWGSSSNATEYDVYLYSDGAFYASYIAYSTSLTFSGLPIGKTYYYVVHGYNSAGSSSGRTSNSVYAADTTAPVFSYVNGDGYGRMQVAYSAYDNGIGMRSFDTYYVEISNPNGTTYGNGMYTTALYRTFTSDAYGNEFVNGSYYYMRVTAYDAAGNARSSSVRIQYVQTRPQDWTWTYPKVSGQNLYFPASEWIGFCNRVNAFRQYKNLSNYTFATVYSGNPIFALQLNEAINAINAMVVNKLSTQSSGADANADAINSMSSRLNSIQ